MMKAFKLAFTALFFIALPLLAQNEWEWQNPVPQGNPLNNVQIIDANTIYAGGDASTFMRSTDGGSTWEVIHDLYDNDFGDLEDMHFVDANTGYAVGIGDRVAKTTDGGVTWNISSTNLFLSFDAVFFIDANTGWVSGNGIQVAKTTDGGNTWTSYPLTQSNFINDLYFVDANNGWAVGTLGIIYRTTDGGITWTEIQNGGPTLLSVYFVDTNIGYISGALGTILKTTDGGLTWSSQVSGSTGAAFYGIHFHDADNGTAVASDGFIVTTADGGNSWTSRVSNTENFLYDVKYVSATELFSVGIRGTVLQSTDAGVTWADMTQRVDAPWLTRIKMIDATSGWAAGQQGGIMQTTDGINWDLVQSTNGDIFDVSTPDASSAFFISTTGKLVRTLDFGSTWDTYDVSTNSIIYTACEFPSLTTGYVLGYFDHLAKSTDGGMTWTEINGGGTNTFMNDLHFIDDNTGWLGGRSGTLIHTLDGGVNWTPIVTPTTSDIIQIYFSDINNGWILADNLLYKTVDGGTSWSLLNSASGIDIERFVIIDSNTIWATGKVNFVPRLLLSTDGGTTWQEENLPTGGNGNDLSFIDVDTGWVGDAAGNIMKRTLTPVGIEEISTPGQVANFELFSNYPNPFNPETSIRFSLKESGRTTLIIYNIAGQKVRTLVDEDLSTGTFEIRWNGRDAENNKVASGIYLYRLENNNAYQTRRMMLLK